MNRIQKEHNILDQAIAALYRETTLQLAVVEHDAYVNNQQIDAIVKVGANEPTLLVEIKKWANHTNVGTLIHQMEQIAKPDKVLLVADFINPIMGEKLKEAGIQYIDTIGNAHINLPPIHIYLKGNRPEQQTNIREKTGRAFQPTGMKVVFAFLKNPDLVNKTYRTIADQTQVALGTIREVFHDLTARGLLVTGTKGRELTNFDQLLNQWVEHYPYRLMKKQRIGLFTTNDPAWWQKIDPEVFGAQWGGEIAAAEYTHYLNPKDVTIYIPKTKMAALIREAHLRKIQPDEHPETYIDLIEPFWWQEETINLTHLVHPLIAYADLIASGEPRNLETAERLREQLLH